MMTVEEAFEIIMHDTDYTDLRKWEARHWEAQDTYWRGMGFSDEVRRRMKEDLLKVKKNVEIRRKGVK